MIGVVHFGSSVRLVVWSWLVVAFGALPGLGADTVRARRGELSLPTYPWVAVKHPYFRGTDKVNIYPYPMLDFLSREQTNRTYRTVILENEYLRITFLPELGGKVHEVLDKTTGQPMFYVNHVIKPGLIGQCGAWTSGGIEWNTGPQGHTVSCMTPVPVEILAPEKDGSQSVAIGETERIYGTRWAVIVTLRPGRSFIEERVRIYNPTETVRPYYFWNCTAVPNTPGFRFIYPMTLGTDHAAEKFFHWPIDHGKDLSRGTNYEDASSIFAWHCDQDFFGSYDDGADRGVVACANHYQVPGKKAWTWGQGGFGKMHQMDLTDHDGPYNEVQTGPLLTQGEVGRLDPCEAVTWEEWWYPVHGIGGFTFANKDVAVNAARKGGELRLRMIGSGKWNHVKLEAWRRNKRVAVGPSLRVKLDPGAATEVRLAVGGEEGPVRVKLTTSQLKPLADFLVPLAVPERQPPEKKAPPHTAAELAQAGWENYLFARFAEAETSFRQALDHDPKCVEANTGLAYLKLDADPSAAVHAARAALDTCADHGSARLALAVAELRLGDETGALDDAWLAARSPETTIAAHALAAKLLIRKRDYAGAIACLSEDGPWISDLVCQDRLAWARLKAGSRKMARAILMRTLWEDPLDPQAQAYLYFAGSEKEWDWQKAIPPGRPDLAIGLSADLVELGEVASAERLVRFGVGVAEAEPGANNPALWYWTAYLTSRGSAEAPGQKMADHYLALARAAPLEGVFPSEAGLVPALQWALEQDPRDGRAALLLGHLLFHLGRHDQGRAMWKRAAELGAEPVIAYRALGMASLTLDKDAAAAVNYLGEAHVADPSDAIVARDLTRVLLAEADKADEAERKRELWGRARATLQPAFAAGKGRSDFVALLARVQNRLGDYAGTAQMLDSVRVTVWEGAHEVHDLFEEAHLALGKAQLKASHATEALAEFNRALEYPENLATGKLENTREAHIQFLRGEALAALGRKQEALAAWRLAADEPESKDAEKESARKKAKEALQRGLVTPGAGAAEPHAKP